MLVFFYLQYVSFISYFEHLLSFLGIMERLFVMQNITIATADDLTTQNLTRNAVQIVSNHKILINLCFMLI